MEYWDIFSTISSSNPLFRTIPLLRLLGSTVIEIIKDYKEKQFYCKTLIKIKDNKPVIRKNCDIFKLKNENDDNCPIYINLKKTLSGNCPQPVISDVFWCEIKDLCIRYQQASFFDVLLVQFILSFIASILDGFHSIAQVFLLLFIFFSIIPITLVIFTNDTPTPIFVNKALRIIFIILVWMITVALMLYPLAG
jgi:hypothetical protein